MRQENAGRSGARNRAVLEARSELLSFLDSDDRWLPDKLERQAPVLERDEPGRRWCTGTSTSSTRPET